VLERDVARAQKPRYNASFTTKWAGSHRPFFLGVCFWTVIFARQIAGEISVLSASEALAITA
jgi:hypothetical protein